ncbi:unnamed protein product, partial [Chrysoparadoxa australica]
EASQLAPNRKTWLISIRWHHNSRKGLSMAANNDAVQQHPPILLSPAASVNQGSAPGSGSNPRGSKRRRREGGDRDAGAAASNVADSFTFCQTGQEQSDFFERIRELYHQQLLCDVSLIVSGQTFKAHKSVLMGHRSFLGALMTTEMKESKQSVIELQDTDPAAFRTLLDYMYGMPINVPVLQITSVLGLACRYQVSGLTKQVCSVLTTALDPENSASIFAAADLFSCTDLRAKAFNKLVGNFARAVKTEGFENLDEFQIVQVLGSDMILDCDESVVFDAAAAWLSHSPRRAALAGRVMALIRFPLMDAGLLSDVIKNKPVMQTPECKAYLAEAWEHQALVAAGREGHQGCPRTRLRRRSCTFTNHKLLQEHSDAVSALTVVNGNLISGSWDSLIKVWNPQTWLCERTLSDHTGTIRCFAVVDDDKLISGSDDCTIKIWNSETWTLVRSLTDHDDIINAVVMCHSRLASCSDDGNIKLWNTATWQCEVTIHHESGGVLSLAVCGDKLVSGSDDAVIKVYSTQSWACEKVIEQHRDEVWALQSIGSQLVSGSTDGSVCVWDTDTWDCQRVLNDHRGAVYCIVMLDGKVLTAGSDETIRVWTEDWQCERVLQCSGVWAMTVHENQLVSGSLDNAVKV